MRSPADPGLVIEILAPPEAADGPPADSVDACWEPQPLGPSRLEPWFEQAAAIERQLDKTFFRLGRRRAMTRSGNPRRDSRVRQHVWHPFSSVRERLPSGPTVVEARGVRLHLRTGFEPAPKGALRAAGILRLRASWPALRVWVTVEPWWRNRTVATIALRTNHRWRYPRRYFGAAHAAVRALAVQSVGDGSAVAPRRSGGSATISPSPALGGPYKSRTCDLLRVEQAL